MAWKLAIVLAAAGCGFQVGAAVDASVTGDANDAAGAPADMPPDMFLPTAQWTRRKAITIDGNKISGGPHTGFPLLIDLSSDPDLAADANTDGGDIMFLAGDTVTRLPYQREKFVKATGELIAWVRLPVLSGSAPTTIYLYYGNPNATDQQDPGATWTDGHRGVWHLDEVAGGTNAIKDSTVLGNHGSSLGNPTLDTAGVIGAAVRFDGLDDRISIADSASLDASASTGTAEMWVKFVDPSANRVQLVMSSSNAFAGTPDGFSWAVQADGDHYFYPWVGNNNDYNLTAKPFAKGAWAHAAVTWAFATKEVRLYVNGAPLGITVLNVPTLWTQVASPAAWLWGGNPGDPAATFFAGQLDELRVSNVVRTPGWIQTEYRNQSSPPTFYTLGVATSL